jgi:hypothetical protein
VGHHLSLGPCPGRLETRAFDRGRSARSHHDRSRPGPHRHL